MATTPTSIVNRVMGLEAFTDALSLPAGTTIGGRTVDSANSLVDCTTATLTVTQALHDGKIILLDKTGGTAVTLPAATGTGMRLRFIIKKVDTTGYTIATAPTTDIFKGQIIAASTAETPDLTQPWVTSTNSNLITLNGTTTGGVSVGDIIELVDIAAGVWALWGAVTASGTEATPLSHV